MRQSTHMVYIQGQNAPILLYAAFREIGPPDRSYDKDDHKRQVKKWFQACMIEIMIDI